MVVGMITQISLLLLPLMAWAIFPRDWDFVLFNSLESKIDKQSFNDLVLNCFIVHSWQIFLFVCALPSLFSGVGLFFMPESPKFLMSQGRNSEALQAFQKVFHINTGKPKDSYPVGDIVH